MKALAHRQYILKKLSANGILLQTRKKEKEEKEMTKFSQCPMTKKIHKTFPFAETGSSGLSHSGFV